jgi:hypothetical protein
VVRYLVRLLLFTVAAVVVLFGVILAGGSVLEGFIEKNFIFFPTRSLAFTPREWGMDFEDVFFAAPDGVRLNAWLIEAGDDVPMVLWFHGNAGNIADRVDNARLLVKHGLSLLMVEYRGYGNSEGEPSEHGIYRDGQAAFDYLIAQGIQPENLVVFGRSLGSAVAVRVASDNPCAGVILETPFTNMAEMARFHYPIIPGLGRFSGKFNSIDRIGSISAPILFIHGDADELVPLKFGRKLFEAATSEKQFYLIPGAHHNDTYLVGGQRYFDTFTGFVRKTTGRSDPSDVQR